MSEVTLTLTGFVATEPRHVVSASGTAYTTFRTATTRRYFDRAEGQWRDGQTLWFTVKTWRETARNVAASLRKGDPIVAQGVLGVDEWVGADGPRTTLVLEARSVGPDLARGEARFVPVQHRSTVPDQGVGSVIAVDTAPDAAVASHDPWATAPEACETEFQAVDDTGVDDTGADDADADDTDADGESEEHAAARVAEPVTA